MHAYRKSYIYCDYYDKRMIKEILAFLLENSYSESSTLVLETLNLQTL
jgi:hypothetical protein